MNFVLDASITLAWCFAADEASPQSIDLLEKLETATAFVPELWALEVGNILAAAERRKRINHAHIVEFFTLLQNLNIQTDRETTQRAFREIFALSHAEGMTTYDAAYIELAMRLGIPLATKDQQMREVAQRVGVVLI